MRQRLSDWLIFEADGRSVGFAAAIAVGLVYFVLLVIVFQRAPFWLKRLGLDIGEDGRPERVLLAMLIQVLLAILLPLPAALALAVGLVMGIGSLLAG